MVLSSNKVDNHEISSGSSRWRSYHLYRHRSNPLWFDHHCRSVKMITLTSLTHPTMMSKIKLAMKLASSGEGEKMNGHGNRCYIEDRNGRLIMRLQYEKMNKRFRVYGDESRDITKVVAAAIKKFHNYN